MTTNTPSSDWTLTPIGDSGTWCYRRTLPRGADGEYVAWIYGPDDTDYPLPDKPVTLVVWPDTDAETSYCDLFAVEVTEYPSAAQAIAQAEKYIRV